ncbi:hypothetical protein GCM10023189_20280 [Nibrella saemangeumensis]|uniref:Uncharacterized protein n=1 Tax=Nibrella saemangeumensis TaxID=1084526 RepID=A0ABP8MTF5_9BACT
MVSAKKTILAGCTAGLLYVVAARPADIIKDLGLTEDLIKEEVLTNFKYDEGWSFYPAGEIRTMARKIPESSRAVAVQALGKVVRAYVESSAFSQTYQSWLREEYLTEPKDEQPEEQPEEKKPQPTSGDPREQVIQELYGDMPASLLTLMVQEQIKEANASKTGKTAATPTTKPLDGKELTRISALAKATPDKFKQQYLHYLAMNVDPAVQVMLTDGRKMQDEQQAQFSAQERKERQAEYQKRKDLKQVTRNRLSHFIALINTIDFDAKLIRRGNKMAFADPALEGKDGDWKFLYRLGKEPVMAARTVAQQWLADLDKGKTR